MEISTNLSMLTLYGFIKEINIKALSYRLLSVPKCFLLRIKEKITKNKTKYFEKINKYEKSYLPINE